ncbi:MAG: M56 family metallopeptidase [Chloroflexales bacterium]|nr:M56 family metallopeptidase [Chloroflexales bacterium]
MISYQVIVMKANAEPRLDPFAFPSETTLRFILLIVAVISASLFMYSTLYVRYIETQGRLEPIAVSARACWDQYEPSFSLSADELAITGNAFAQCTEPLYTEFRNAAWLALGGIGILLCIASLLYSLFPILIMWREGLTPLDMQADMEDVVVYLKNLCQEMGIHPPTFLQKPASRAIGGRAFGAFGRYYVVLPTGLLNWFDNNRDAFRAVMLHELAHLRNRDVDKTYFAVAVSCAFVIAALIPFAFNLLGNSSAQRFIAIVQTITLVLLVYLTLAAVVRAREFYADVRASTYPGAQALSSLLATTLQPTFSAWQATTIAMLERLPHFKRHRWQFAFLLHPDASERRHILATTDRLFILDLWAAFGTGIAVTAVHDTIAGLSITTLRPILGHIDPWLESLAASLVFALLVVGIIGIGVWRGTFATLIRNQHSTRSGKLGIGLGLGLIFGQILSFDHIASIQDTLGLEQADRAMQFTLTIFNLLWSVLLLLSLYYFFRWMAAGASIWLHIAIFSRSPRPYYIAGLVVAGLWMTLWFEIMFLIRNADVLLITPNSIAVLFNFIFFFSLILHDITLQPLTLIALVSLWAFPLSAWLWQVRRTNSTSGPTWGFLDQIPDQAHLPTQQPLQVHPAFMTGLMGGLIYCVLLLILRLGLRFLLPESVWEADEFKLVLFYAGYIGLATLIQAGIAMKVARRIRSFGKFHGLFAAFTAGCVMALGALVTNLLFSGTVNAQFAWTTFSLTVNWGALLALLGMMILPKPSNQANLSQIKAVRSQ